MSAFGNVNFTETDNSLVESTAVEMETESVVEQQVEKFDTSFNTNKLQELYAEFDKITIDEEKVKNLTQVKENAVSNRIPFRLALGITTTAIITVLLVFLCVYNIFVINGMDNSIRYLQEEVISYEQDLTTAEIKYNGLTDPTTAQNWLANNDYSAMEYSDVPSPGCITAVSVGDVTEVIELQGETNWFDSVCNFISQIFG